VVLLPCLRSPAALRQHCLYQTELATAAVGTIRTQLLKLGANPPEVCDEYIICSACQSVIIRARTPTVNGGTNSAQWLYAEHTTIHPCRVFRPWLR